MSGRIQGALYGRELTAPQMLVALAMADHADHDGNNVRPAQATIAWKTGKSLRQVQRLQAELRDLGVLEVTKNPGRSSPTEYRMRPDAVPLRPRPDAKGRHSDVKVAVSGDKGRHSDVVQTVQQNHKTATRSRTPHQQMMDSIVEAMGWNPKEVSDPMWGEIRKASKVLRDLGVDPWAGEVKKRAAVYRKTQPGKLGPMALVKWWADCAPETKCPNRCGPDGFYYPDDRPYPVACEHPGCVSKRKVKT